MLYHIIADCKKREKGNTVKMRNYTFREMEKILLANGYTLIRCRGDHYVYKKEGEVNIVTLAKKKHVNPCIAKRLIKEQRLIVEF